MIITPMDTLRRNFITVASIQGMWIRSSVRMTRQLMGFMR